MCFGLGGKKKPVKDETDEEQEIQKAEAEEAKRIEAEKIAETKEEALEEKIQTLSTPLSSMISRQDELGVKRKGSRGRRSLLTSSGGGMGYYSRFNS